MRGSKHRDQQREQAISECTQTSEGFPTPPRISFLQYRLSADVLPFLLPSSSANDGPAPPNRRKTSRQSSSTGRREDRPQSTLLHSAPASPHSAPTSNLTRLHAHTKTRVNNSTQHRSPPHSAPPNSAPLHPDLLHHTQTHFAIAITAVSIGTPRQLPESALDCKATAGTARTACMMAPSVIKQCNFQSYTISRAQHGQCYGTHRADHRQTHRVSDQQVHLCG